MATLLTLKRRIKTAKNVSKTTKAMQMISASKLKKGQTAAMLSKPYVEKLDEISKNLSQRIDKSNLSEYMVKNLNINQKLIIVISPDKGLSGGLVTNLIREVINFDKNNKNFFLTIGKKAETYVSALGKEIIASFIFGTSLPSFDTIFPIVNIVDDYFLNKKVSEVIIITTRFVNVFSQIPNTSTVLPIVLEEPVIQNKNMVFDPNEEELLPALLQHYLEMAIYQAILESYASEQAARMIAMKNATDNALEIIGELQLMYNKTRQERITNELLDIGGGAFANYE